MYFPPVTNWAELVLTPDAVPVDVLRKAVSRWHRNRTPGAFYLGVPEDI